ncbi:MAG: hypothetical protein J6Y62_02220 [Clostridia bacterium]|nr:hypothetical protein [Clostridia bacterium]
MNTYLRKMELHEAKQTYKKHLKRHFPRDEIKPWKSIVRMWKDDSYFVIGLYEDPGDVPSRKKADALRGYAFFVAPSDCDALLLDYYAILPAYRSDGLGGRTLRRLAEMARAEEKYILLETEDIDFAKSRARREECTRRDAFYERNGCVKTDVKGSVFSVKYAVWMLGMPFAPSQEDPLSGHIRSTAFDRACADMNTLYRKMVPGEKNTKFVDIHRI